MSQNAINLTLSDQQLVLASQALDRLEEALSSLISLKAEDRRRLNKMGPKSEVFCRQALQVLAQNPRIVPASVDMAGAQAELATLDQLAPLLSRMRRLVERGNDTEMALGSDVMEVALEGYALLKVSGKQQGLDGPRRELGTRWAKTRRIAAEPAEA